MEKELGLPCSSVSIVRKFIFLGLLKEALRPWLGGSGALSTSPTELLLSATSNSFSEEDSSSLKTTGFLVTVFDSVGTFLRLIAISLA